MADLCYFGRRGQQRTEFPTGAGSYHFGEEACVIAEPADGYRFVQWNDGDTEPERYFDVTHDVELTATFEPDEP